MTKSKSALWLKPKSEEKLMIVFVFRGFQTGRLRLPCFITILIQITVANVNQTEGKLFVVMNVGLELPCLTSSNVLLDGSSSTFACDVCRKTVALQGEMFFFVQDDSRLTGKKPQNHPFYSLVNSTLCMKTMRFKNLLSSNRRSQTVPLFLPPGGAEGAVGGEEKHAPNGRDW